MGHKLWPQAYHMPTHKPDFCNSIFFSSLQKGHTTSYFGTERWYQRQTLSFGISSMDVIPRDTVFQNYTKEKEPGLQSVTRQELKIQIHCPAS